MQEPKRCRNHGRPKSSSLCFVSPSQAKVHTQPIFWQLASEKDCLHSLLALCWLDQWQHRSFLNTWGLESCSSSCRWVVDSMRLASWRKGPESKNEIYSRLKSKCFEVLQLPFFWDQLQLLLESGKCWTKILRSGPCFVSTKHLGKDCRLLNLCTSVGDVYAPPTVIPPKKTLLWFREQSTVYKQSSTICRYIHMYNTYTGTSRARKFQGIKTIESMHAWQPTSAMPRPNFWCAPGFRRSVFFVVFFFGGVSSVVMWWVLM